MDGLSVLEFPNIIIGNLVTGAQKKICDSIRYKEVKIYSELI